jgi:hypothetical protein
MSSEREHLALVADEAVKRQRERQPATKPRASSDPPKQRQQAQIEPLSLVELMGQEFSPIRWAVDELLPEGTILIAGKPKSGKSWLVLNVLVSAQLREPFLRRTVNVAGRVLYLDLEGTARRMQSRMRELMVDRMNRIRELAGFDYRFEWPRGADGAALLDEYLTKHPDCRIVAVDVLAKIRPIVDSSRRGAYAEDYEAIACWKAIADKHRITLLLVHHTRKAEADDVFDEVSGTLGINGAVDQIVVLKRTPNDPKRATLHMRGRDLPEDHELGIELRAGWWHYLGTAAAVAANDSRLVVMDALRESETPMTTGDLLKATGKRSRGSLTKLLCRMVEAGQIKREGRGYALPE